MGYRGQEKEIKQKLALENEFLSWFPNWPDSVYIQSENVGQRGIISWQKYAKQTLLSYITVLNALQTFLSERRMWHKSSLQMKWQKIDIAALAYNIIHLPKL